MCALPVGVRAHEPPHGIRLVWSDPAADATPIVLANRGIVFPDPGGASEYRLRCNEGYHALVGARPGAMLDDMGELVIATTQSVSHTSDRACTLSESSGLPTRDEQATLDLSLGGFAQDPSAPNRALVSTQVYQSPAKVYVSEDYARTWTALSTNNLYSVYRELLIAADGQHVLASGQRYDQPAKKLYSIYGYSTDGGKTWTDSDLTTERTPLGFLTNDPNIAFMREKIPNLNIAPRDRLLRSSDGGKTFEAIGGEWDPLGSFAASADGSAVFVGSRFGGLFRSTDQGKTFTRVREDMITGADCLYFRQNVLWTCMNVLPNSDGIWRSTDLGETFQKVLEFQEVTEQVECADVEICELPWRDWTYELLNGWNADGGMPDGGAQDAGADAGAEPQPEVDASVAEPDAGVKPAAKADDGCSVASPGWAGLSWCVLAGLALVRRRRQPR